MAKSKEQPWDSEREVTAGGSEIMRHEASEKTLKRLLSPFSSNTLSEGDMDNVSAHVEKHIGKIESVFHEMLSDDLHIDVNFVKPSERVPYNFLCTMGMSALPMHVPKGYDGPKYAELCIYLPPNWPLTQKAFEKHGEDAYWPVRWLKMLSRLPNDYETFLGVGHTIPNGDPPEPLSPRCKFVGVALLPSPDDEFQLLKVGKREIAFFVLAPLYAEEMQLKLDKGMEEVVARFEKANIHPCDLASPKRPNVA